MAARIAPGDALVGWCALVHDLGKGITPRERLPRHDSHETAGLPLVQALAERLKVPAEFAAMARADYERSGKLVRDANIKTEQ